MNSMGRNIISERGKEESEPDFFPSQAWEPSWTTGELYALAACGKHYFDYPPANVLAGDLPCKRGCASVAFATHGSRR